MCKKVPFDVQEEMVKVIKKLEARRKKASDSLSTCHEAYSDNPPSLEINDELEEEKEEEEEDIKPTRKKQ